MVDVPATPRNITAIHGGAYPATKEASAAKREKDELQWVGMGERERERASETGLTTMHQC